MTTNSNNDITNDRITNTLKGNKEKYRTGWEAIFGDKDMKKHVEQITGDVPHTVVDDFYCYSCYDEGEIPCQDEGGYFICPDCNDTDNFLDKLTQMNEDMGLYDDE